jgi:anaphase-promoting complex subunit 6
LQFDFWIPWLSVKNEKFPVTNLSTLSKKYNLDNDPDLQLIEAQTAFNQLEYTKALSIISRILNIDPYSISCLPLHISILYELQEKSKLFILGHQLVDALPNEAISWYAVGTYYLTIGKHHEARRYFTKSSTMDPLFGIAWIGFGHSFAFESEHDQAISAYSTASRILKGYFLWLK